MIFIRTEAEKLHTNALCVKFIGIQMLKSCGREKNEEMKEISIVGKCLHKIITSLPVCLEFVLTFL